MGQSDGGLATGAPVTADEHVAQAERLVEATYGRLDDAVVQAQAQLAQAHAAIALAMYAKVSVEA